MATLTVWKFGTTRGAENAADILKGLAQQEIIRIHDAAIVEWDDGTKKPRTRQLSGSTTKAGALGGTFWGLLFGLIFFVPLLGAAIGAATGALAGSLADVGIDDSFINKVRDQVTPGTSALFLLSSDAVIDKVHHAFEGEPQGELIFTNLSDDQESAIREVFYTEPMAFLELRDLDGTLGGTGVRLVLTGLSSSVRAHAEGSTWFSDWAASGRVFDTVEGALDALQDAPPQEEAP